MRRPWGRRIAFAAGPRFLIGPQSSPRGVVSERPAGSSSRAISRRALFGFGLSRVLEERLAHLDALTPDEPSPAERARLGLEAYRASLRRGWEAGDIGEQGRRLRPAALALVDVCAPGPGQRLLDVGAGDGNVAVAAARRGADVVAVDLSPAAVEAGRARTEREEAAPIDWLEADAEALPLDDESFDSVVSAFGAMFAPRPRETARELMRVARPGATVGMANWASSGFMADALNLATRFAPLPAGVQRAARWGRYETVYLHLFDLAELDVEERSLPLRFSGADAAARWLAETPGPPGSVVRELEPEPRTRIEGDLLAIAARHGTEAPEGGLTVDARYVLVSGTKQ